MNDDHDVMTKREEVASFAEVARQVRAPLSARQRMAGWQRLQQTLATGREAADERAFVWWRWPSPRLVVELSIAFVFVAVAIPVARLMLKRGEPRTLEVVIAGGISPDGKSLAPGSLVSATQGPVALLYTDGSRIALRPLARLSVAGLTAQGSDVQLLDGMIDVDVKHRRPDVAWTFRAGPYTVRVTGTSFALGWDTDRRRLELRMRAGAVSLVGPVGRGARDVIAGESLYLDEHGEGASDVAGGDVPEAAEVAPVAEPVALAPAVRAPSPTLLDRNRKSAQRRASEKPRDTSNWARLLGRGEFGAIVAAAENRGIYHCLKFEGEQNLAALADAARYTHRRDLARRSLMALRGRFPATERSQDAAFFLARLGETAANSAEALSWYERYLREAARGSYAEEALGREMMLLQRSSETNEARGVARRYLDAYPHGVYAGQAAGLLSGSPPP